MSKAVLVMDMPDTCEKCKFCDYGDYTCRAFGILGKSYTYDIPEDGHPVPDWCPLKPIPEKIDYHANMSLSQMGEMRGWNACIDTICGKEREDE